MSDFMEHGKTGCGASYDHLIRNIIEERTTEQAVKKMKDHERSALVQGVVLEAKKTHFSKVVKNHKMAVSNTTTTSAMTKTPSENECPSTAAGAPNSTMTPTVGASASATPAPAEFKCMPAKPTVASGSTSAPARPPPATNLCNVCGAKSVSRCSRCQLVHYCSVDCQRKDWKTHKRVCKGGKMRERTERAEQSQRAPEQSQPGEGLMRLLKPYVMEDRPSDFSFDPLAPDPFTIREEPPDDFDADGMMAGLLREHSIHGTTGSPMFDELVRDYLDYQRGGGT